MENIKIKDILEATGGILLNGNPNTEICHISIDSRNMRGNDLFVPLIGEKFDAHRFIIQAIENGAKASLTSEHDMSMEQINGALIRVADTKAALQNIGRYVRKKRLLPLVGITGSVGKTTTREMVAAALSAKYQVFKTAENHNSQVGVPITITEIKQTDEIAVLELGMSEPGEMSVIARISQMDSALITNIGVTHIENLGSRENILHEKLNIQDGLKEGGTLFLNGDDALLRGVRAREGYHTVYYGIEAHNDYHAEQIKFSEGKPSFVMVHGEERIPVQLQMIGEHHILNALAALAVADLYQVPLEKAAMKLYDFDGFKNRQQVYKRQGITMIDDTYNASPDSMRAGIKVLSSIPVTGRRMAVLADMKELGEDTLQFHKEIGTFLVSHPIDVLITYGKLAEEIAEGAKREAEIQKKKIEVLSFDERKKNEMTAYLMKTLKAGDAVLFKGSNSMKLSETAEYFIRADQEET